MTDLLKIGLSALLAQQRALGATSNNIANANTPGYSRQRAEFGERAAERLGNGLVGTGVDVVSVRRITDDIAAQRLYSAASSFTRSEAFAGLAAGIDDLLAADQTGINTTLQNLVNAGQDLADDPAGIPARRVLLSEGENLVSRFQMFDRRLGEIGSETTTRIRTTVTEINGLGESIAEVNQQLLSAGVPPGGQLPPDLLDQRDRLLGRLAELIKVDTVQQSDGTLSVFIGSGQALVLGTTASTLTAGPGEFNPAGTDISISGGGGSSVTITQFLSGGELGGLLDFRREMLDPARANVGRMAVGLTETFNQIHRDGMDMNGQLGADFFDISASQVFPSRNNTGAANVSVSVADVSLLQPTAYRFDFDGAVFQMFRADDGTAVTLSGTGVPADPYTADGLSIVVSGAAAAGDQFLIDPLSAAAGTMNVLLNDAAQVAAAAPIRTRAELANVGDATISAGEVADIADPNLLATTTITFLDPNTYSVNGAGAFAYTSGADIVVNGSRVQIAGSAVAGDEFIIESNAGGVGDNRNALRLAGVLGIGLLDGGATDLRASVGQLISTVGAQTAEVMNQRDAQGLLLQQAEEALDSARGVNLDEEAANLLRHEQMYQAAAQTISVADTLFQSLLLAIRR